MDDVCDKHGVSSVVDKDIMKPIYQGTMLIGDLVKYHDNSDVGIIMGYAHYPGEVELIWVHWSSKDPTYQSVTLQSEDTALIKIMNHDGSIPWPFAIPVSDPDNHVGTSS